MFEDSTAVAIDYETMYSTRDGYSLSCMDTERYCADSRFDPYLVAICGREIFRDRMEHHPQSVYRELDDGRQLYVGRPERFDNWLGLDGRLLLAHNARFEVAVTNECWRRGIFPRWPNVKWLCTADMAAYLMAPRNLKGAVEVLLGKEISKAVRAGMDGRHDYDLTPDEYRDLVEYGGSDAVECHDLFENYGAEFPEIERAISEQKRDASVRGILVDRAYAEAALKELKRYQAEVEADIPWYPERPVGSLPALRQAVIGLGMEPPKSFKKDDPGFLDWQREHEDIPFIAARQKAVAINMHATRIKGLLESLDDDDVSHPQCIFYGAHTGRDSGKSSVGKSSGNLLNLPRKPVLQDDEHVFGGKGVDLRGMYVARPGHKFVVYDYSQIEARFSLWLADDTHMMEAMKREGNLYQANAVMMGWCRPGEKIKKEKPDVYRLAKCCLTGETLVLVRSKKLFGKGLTRPYYKRIISVVATDQVWDGHEWVPQHGAERMKYVKKEELIEVGGVCLTRDHRVYVDDSTSRRADEVLGDEAAAAVAWSQSQGPVQGWTHVRLLASALARLGARALCLCTREAVRLLAGALSLHGVRKGDTAVVGQCAEGSDDQVREVRASGEPGEGRAECVGEDAR